MRFGFTTGFHLDFLSKRGRYLLHSLRIHAGNGDGETADVMPVTDVVELGDILDDLAGFQLTQIIGTAENDGMSEFTCARAR